MYYYMEFEWRICNMDITLLYLFILIFFVVSELIFMISMILSISKLGKYLNDKNDIELTKLEMNVVSHM